VVGFRRYPALQTPAGQFQLDMNPVLFEMSQELVAG